MAHDVNGTPFIFAAWITSSEAAIQGRIIDHMVFPPESGEEGSDYGIEQKSVFIEGCGPVVFGNVILSDRAEFRKEIGQEFFSTGGSSWIIGHAHTEAEALEIMRSAIVPGEWPDPRGYDYPEPDDCCETEDDALCPAA